MLRCGVHERKWMGANGSASGGEGGRARPTQQHGSQNHGATPLGREILEPRACAKPIADPRVAPLC
eukprot:COSAG06_NODE_14893_length_1116_cov_1.229105_1_plen_66_part_00